LRLAQGLRNRVRLNRHSENGWKAALGKNGKALATFENLSASHKREYVEWIAEAKRDETRAKRLATAIEWMAEGKVREWRYIRK
jgi:uncharacterized protein YdeI (YjbR/CyaY-like superfamily)